MRVALLLTSLMLALAGCLAAEVTPASTLDSTPGGLTGLVAHTAAGIVPLGADAALLATSLVDTTFSSGEPSVGVTSDGALYVTGGGARIGRSIDRGATWVMLTGSDAVNDPKLSLDPWIWVDPITDRVFNAPLYVACTWMAFSDDGGDSWDSNPVAGCGIPAHDHQKLTTGAPAKGVTPSGYPNVIYYQYNSFRQEGSWVSTSLDGGKTFGLGQLVHPADCHAGIAGPVIAGADGVAYLAKPTCDGLNIAVTGDSGETWEITGKVENAGISQVLAVTVDTAVDAAGNPYAVFTGKDGLIYLTRSTDAGKTWSDAVRVSPPQVTATTFAVMVAGEDGRIAIGYLGTKDDTKGWAAPDAQSADADTRWHAWITIAENATAMDPVFTTIQVTPDDDPVQIGCIWLSGGSNDCRNLGDFIDMTIHEGRPILVYPDGCDACKVNTESRATNVFLAIVDAGPSLLGGLLSPYLASAADAPVAPPASSTRPPVAVPQSSLFGPIEGPSS